jgi:hypothetical protein
LQYTFDFGLGAFVRGYLPLGVSEEIFGSHPEFYVDFAVFYDNNFGDFTLYGEIVYFLDLEGDDLTQQGRLSVKVQPGYMVMDVLEIMLAAEFNTRLGVFYDGELIDNSSSYVFSMMPGVSYQVLDFLKLSLEIPFSLFGQGSEAYVTDAASYWGINFKATFNFL